MPHDADFTDAHRRHWEDAELLYDHERWANADQLYGFSAECGLKAVMERLGMPSGTPGRYRRHIQELWPIFEDFAKNRDGDRYLELLPDGEPFADWAHHDRYVHRGRFSQVTVSPHREAAQRVRLMVGFGAQDEEP